MVLFRINQVPDRLFVHFLNLVGITPFPPSVARADLTFWLSAVQDVPVVVPAGMQVSTGSEGAGTEPVVFTTATDLVIAPPTLRAALTRDNEGRYSDVYDDLRFPGAAVQCFTSASRDRASDSRRRPAARFRRIAGRDGDPADGERVSAGGSAWTR